MVHGRRSFTVLELLVSIAIIAILTAVLLPSLSESRMRARFVRWLQFNKQCSTDPTCVINLNFQEGKGDVLTNSAQAHEAEGFNVNDYNGIIKGDYEWGQGRWTKNKRAVQLDGVSTYIEFAESKHVDFAGEDGFTAIISLKLDCVDNWVGIFGKCFMRNATNGYPQYAIYIHGGHGNYKGVREMLDVDIGEVSATFYCISQNEERLVNLSNDTWFQVALRNRPAGENQEIDVFVNGIKLKSTYNKFGSSQKERDAARLAVGCIRWLVNNNNNNDNNGKPDNFMKGKIDEFLVYSRALTDIEIRDHYLMGAERGD